LLKGCVQVIPTVKIRDQVTNTQLISLSANQAKDTPNHQTLAMDQFWHNYLGCTFGPLKEGKEVKEDVRLLTEFWVPKPVAGTGATLDIYVNPALGSRFCIPAAFIDTNGEPVSARVKHKNMDRQVLLYHGREPLDETLNRMNVYEPWEGSSWLVMSHFGTDKDPITAEEFYGFQLRDETKRVQLSCFFSIASRQVTKGFSRNARSKWVAAVEKRLQGILDERAYKETQGQDLDEKWTTARDARIMIVRDLARAYYIMTSMMIVRLEWMSTKRE